MVYEKKKLLILKIVWALALIVAIAVTLNLSALLHKEVELVGNDGKVESYDAERNKTTFSVHVTFNYRISYGTLEVAFYDEAGNLLETAVEDVSAQGEGGKESSATFYVDGKAASYKIDSWRVSAAGNIGAVIAIVFADILIVYFFATTMSQRCKVYDYNGNTVVVYAGRYRDYLKVNDKILDSRFVMSFVRSWLPVELSGTSDGGTRFDAKIPLYGRISLNVDDLPYTK